MPAVWRAWYPLVRLQGTAGEAEAGYPGGLLGATGDDRVGATRADKGPGIELSGMNTWQAQDQEFNPWYQEMATKDLIRV